MTIMRADDRRDLGLVLAWIAAVIFLLLTAGTIFLAAVFSSAVTFARDDGRFANSPLKTWFDSLASGKGLCCSFADGVSIRDVDWGTESVTLAGQASVVYWVMIDGKKIVVPPEAVVTEPNKFGPAVVWPYQDMNGVTQIRCFIPGGGRVNGCAR